MRDRLIELIKQDNCISPFSCSGKCKYVDLDDCHSARLADHLIANGVVVPPVKVGDVVWDRDGELHKVISIEWYSSKVMHLHCEHRTFSVGKRSFGKTVFLTREEAEQALKGGGE